MITPPTFDLELIAAASGYRVRVLAAPIGEVPAQPVILPLDPGRLPIRRTIAEWIRAVRVVMRAEPEELRRAYDVGRRLFDAVFPEQIRAALAASRSALPAGQRLRLRLRLPQQLAALPWELLHDGQEFLALAPDIALVRYPELLAATAAPPRDTGPTRIVAVLASPYGQRPLDLDREISRLEAVLRERIRRDEVVLEMVRGPGTLDQLRDRLRDPSGAPVHALHLLCHGGLAPDGRSGALCFEDPSGDPEWVSADVLRLQIERQRGQTRLVVLNACLGAVAGDDEDPFGSVGAALVRGGVPMVIAMQFEIADESATELARTLYAELAAGQPVDAALAEARRALYARDSFRLDWVIPVLFARGSDWTLLDGHGAGSGRLRRPFDPADLRLPRARALLIAERWPEALALFEQLAEQYHLPGRIRDEVKAARRVAQAAQARRAADQAEGCGDWGTAVIALEQLIDLCPDDERLRDRLAQALVEQELAGWAESAALMAESAEWELVLAVLQRIDERRPGYRHPRIDLAGLRAAAERPEQTG